MDPLLKSWIEEGVKKKARWLIVGWDAMDRDWTHGYSFEESPAEFKHGLDSEIYRVDLTIDPEIAAKHVYLGEEP